MKIKESAENYLETIYVLSHRLGSVRSIDIVNELNFSKPSISVAMKHFRENGLIEMDDQGLITLTEEGLAIAQRTYERHKLLMHFFISLGVSPETADEDACRMEHVLSHETVQCIRKYNDEHFK